MGYIFAFLSVFAMSGTNIIDKILSGTPDKSFSLLVRYSVSLIFLGIISWIFDFHLPPLLLIIGLMGVGILNYLINILMYRGLEKIHTGVFFIIGYLYLIFLFFINILLFGNIEILTVGKMIFGIGFIFCVFAVVYLTGEEHKNKGFVGYLYALGCAIGWTISFAISAYMIKSVGINPITALFCEIIGASIFAVGIFYLKRDDFNGKIYKKKDFLAPSLAGISLSTGLSLFLVAYKYLPANVVNIISLCDLIVTTFFGYYFLHEKIPQKAIIIGGIGFIFLMFFALI